MNRLELGNEFVVLVLFLHMLTQTEITFLAGRHIMGWSFIGMTLLCILVNFGLIFGGDLRQLFRKCKMCVTKRRRLKAWKRQREIDSARKLQMEKY